MPFNRTMCPTFCPSYQDNLEPWRFVLGELLSSPPTLVDWASSRVWSEQFLKWWEYSALCTWEDIAHYSSSLRISISKYVVDIKQNSAVLRNTKKSIAMFCTGKYITKVLNDTREHTDWHTARAAWIPERKENTDPSNKWVEQKTRWQERACLQVA